MDLPDPPFHKPPTEIERIWSNLSSSDQGLLIQQFLESTKLKSHQSPQPVASEGFSKRTLQSPETPNKGGSRKVYPF